MPTRAAARARAAATWRRSAFALVATTLYAVLTVAITWPVPANLRSSLFGFAGDNLDSIWLYWWWDYADAHGLDPDHSPFLSAPFGADLSDVPVQPLERWLAPWLTQPFGEVAAYNLIVLVSFPLAGLSMYLLANYLLRNRLAAALAGGIYAFAPFHLGMAMSYPALGSVQLVPLFFWMLARTLHERRARDVVGAVLAFGLMALGSYYYAYYALWVVAAVVAVYGIRERRALAATLNRARGRLASRRGLIGAGAVGLAGAGVLAFLVAKPLQLYLEADLERSLADAVRYSARPWLWLTPGIDHPMVGGTLEGFYGRTLPDVPSYEQALYLGFVPLGLAALGVLAARRFGGHPRRTVLFAAVVGLAGVVICLGPFLPLSTDYYASWPQEGGERKLPLPGLVIFELAPAFSFFARAQVFVVLGLALAAAAGAVLVQRRLRGGWAGVAIVGLAALIGLEYANRPPPRFVELGPTPAVYEWLAAQPGLPIVAEYPMAPPAEPRTLHYQLWATRHQKPLVNSPDGPQARALYERIANIANPGASAVLARLGVTYAIVHTNLPPATYPPYQPPQPPDELPPGLVEGYPRLERVLTLPDAAVYRVLATPKPAGPPAGTVSFGAGFFAPEGPPGGRFRWMGTRGTLRIRPRSEPGTHVWLRARVQSFGVPRTLTVNVPGGRVVSFPVDPQAREITVPFTLPDGPVALELESSPPADSAAAVSGGADQRALAVSVRNVRLVEAG